MNDQFSYTHMSELINGEPIEVHSLKLYPITMDCYGTFRACRPALLLRLGTLPAVYAVQPYISALFALDMDSIAKTGKPNGGLAQIMTLLCLAMRLPAQYATELIRFWTDPKRPERLTKIQINQGGMTVALTPQQFGAVRETIALQNGEKLPDEAENPELVEALEQKNRIQGPDLDYDFMSLITSVAYKSRIRPQEIMEWTIFEFEQRRKAIDRDAEYLRCAILEANGATWKKGNPVPSWCYDRARGLTDGFVSEAEMLQKFSAVGEVRTG